MNIACESSNYRPGEPLREWDPNDPTAGTDFRLLVQRADASKPLLELLDGRMPEPKNLLKLATLNSWCVIFWYQPITVFIAGCQMEDSVKKLVEMNLKNSTRNS